MASIMSEQQMTGSPPKGVRTMSAFALERERAHQHTMRLAAGTLAIGLVVYLVGWYTGGTGRKHEQVANYGAISGLSMLGSPKHQYRPSWERPSRVRGEGKSEALRGNCDRVKVTPNRYYGSDVEIVWQKPVLNDVRAVIFLAHGCSHSSYDWWPVSEGRTGCPECVGLPEEVRIVDLALKHGFFTIAASSSDRDSGCWREESENLDSPLNNLPNFAADVVWIVFVCAVQLTAPVLRRCLCPSRRSMAWMISRCLPLAPPQELALSAQRRSPMRCRREGWGSQAISHRLVSPPRSGL